LTTATICPSGDTMVTSIAAGRWAQVKLPFNDSFLPSFW